ncbi:MAG TPA: NDP-sugar synthase [Thermoanaerobaculia bacterium]
MPARALVLAAGLGTRLRPLTDSVPKPLLPVAGVPILGHTLLRLRALGCAAVAINLHHRGDTIRRHFGASFGGMPLVYSEEPEILGTLGALHPLRDFLAAADPLLLVNGDSLCRWPLAQLVARHRASGARATLLLASRPAPAAFGGGVGIDGGGDIVSFRRGDREARPVARRLVFAGAHVLAPDLLSRVGPGPADIVSSLYTPLVAEGGRIATLVTDRRWHDLGTPERFLAAALDWTRSSYVSDAADVKRGATIARSLIEAGAAVEADARVRRSVLLPGARAGRGSRISGSILGPGVTVPPETEVSGRLLTADPCGGGGYVSTPLGTGA